METNNLSEYLEGMSKVTIMTNRNLCLIKELDLKIERLKHVMINSPTKDIEKDRKLENEIITLSHEKIQISEQLEKNVEMSLGNLNQHIGRMISKIQMENQVKRKETSGFMKANTVRHRKPKLIRNQDYDLKNPEDDEIYCICKKIQEGEMIECEDKTCRLVWYHFSCVGLNKVPDGQWFCPECAKKLKNNNN